MPRRRTEISKLKAKLTDILDEMESLGSDEVENVRESIDEYMNAASDKALKIKDDVKDKALELKTDADEYAENHPWYLSMYSIIVGVLIGLLLAKSTSKQ